MATLKATTTHLSLVLATALFAASVGHCLSVIEAPSPQASSSKELADQPELVKVLESARPLSWTGVKLITELARESQVIAVHFDQSSSKNLSGRLDATASGKAANKTKQSQEFETHVQHGGSTQGPQIAGVITSGTGVTELPIGLPVAALATSTSTSTTTTESPVTQQQQQTSSSTTEAPPASVVTSGEIPGWPSSGTTTTTTSTSEPAPVGSKTEREGAAVLCGEANANGKSNKRLISDRIVGGYKTEPGEFPFQVRLNIRSRRGSGICGGVVLDQFHILTAAHCMTACVSQHLTTATIESSGVKATIGDHSIKANDGEQELDVETITPHEKYDACNFYANDHDIALIKVASPIQFKFTTDGYGSINRPCMPESRDSSNYQEGDPVIVSGWGVTRENSGALSNILRYVQVPIVNVTRCQETYGSRVTNDHICAGFQVGGKDSCQGDSGGPLVRVVDNRYELVGIVSFGYGCGQPGAPGVYTRVASYIDWIKANL